MSVTAIRAALETALAAMTPALATAWENAEYTPVQGTPYQRVTLMLAEPDNSEIGPQFVQRGMLQVSLFYPDGPGPAAATTRAELIQTAFARGHSFTSGGITVTVEKTPEIATAMQDEDRFHVPVRIRFYAPVNA